VALRYETDPARWQTKAQTCALGSATAGLFQVSRSNTNKRQDSAWRLGGREICVAQSAKRVEWSRFGAISYDPNGHDVSKRFVGDPADSSCGSTERTADL